MQQVHNVPVRAEIEPQQPSQASVTEKKRRISQRLRKAINLLATGECKTQKAAAARVGMHEASLSRELRKPHVRVFLAQCARENISLAANRASVVMTELMESDANGVRFDASRFVLGVEGIKPQSEAQVAVDIRVSAGFVIDLGPPIPPYQDNMVVTEAKEIKDLGHERG